LEGRRAVDDFLNGAEELYKENILDHYREPRNFGRLKNPDLSYEDKNPVCGDVVQMDLRVQDGKVVEVAFSGKGCSISMASASMLTELILNRDIEDLKKFDKQELLDEIGLDLGPVRIKCALLPYKVLKGGIFGLSEVEMDKE
jgi:nitrogen fixation NifU-like protein